MSQAPLGSRRAQLPMLAALVLSFAVPYLIVSLFAGHREAQWRATGLTVHEMRDWHEFGFGSPSEAMRWRNAGFRAPAARIWKERGWDDPRAAFGFHQANFGAHEAKRWHELGFDGEVAREWLDAGFMPDAARRWRDAGEGPRNAASKQKNGLTPGGPGGRDER
jgi:hypothetical protein